MKVDTEGMSHNEAMLHLMDHILTLMQRISNMIAERPSKDYAGSALDIFLHNWLKKAHKGLSEHVREYRVLS